MLSGCASFPDLEQAYEECKQKITPQFDEPESVTWPADGYGYSGSGDSRTIVAVVDEGGERTQVSCTVVETENGWELSRFELSEPRDEVVN